MIVKYKFQKIVNFSHKFLRNKSLQTKPLVVLSNVNYKFLTRWLIIFTTEIPLLPH
jgi:hypothetical protein